MPLWLILGLAFLSFFQQREASTPVAVRQVLEQQAAEWNRGDIRAFMTSYEDSEETAFVGARGVAKGYRRVLESYLKGYPTRDAMGKLTFSDIEVRPLGADYATAIGRFRLERNAQGGGNAEGIFTLVFRKTPGGWKIILDHSQASPSAPPAASR
jgi:ketosteroid isomerase-like protein